MKRHLFVPSADRWVSVEDGTVRDLDDKVLGTVYRIGKNWIWHPGGSQVIGQAPTQAAALAALLADPSCPTPGPNRYDR